MIAEIISIGDELTSGQRLDTNSQWISQQLGDLGVKTVYHTTVADDLAANVRVFATAIDRADVIVATGGLGPTADDLTREAVAKVAGVALALDEPSLAHIRNLFAKHKREMPERNLAQAMFPAGSRPIPNDKGTAPGIDMPIAGGSDDHFSRVFALPGVPAEMQDMFVQSVAPAILAMQPSPQVIRHRRIKCFGVGESQLESMLPDLIARGREPSVGITVHEATITLRITAAGRTSEECQAAMEPTIATIRECLGDLVFGEEDDELEHAVLRTLSERGKSLGTIECGTQGLLAQWLAEANGHTGPYRGGEVLASTPMLFGMLGDRSGLIDEFGLTSREVALKLADSVRLFGNVDYGLAVGPFPPDESGENQPATYHVALASPGSSVAFPSTLVSHKSIWKPRAAKQALNLLRLHLLHEDLCR